MHKQAFLHTILQYVSVFSSKKNSTNTLLVELFSTRLADFYNTVDYFCKFYVDLYA